MSRIVLNKQNHTIKVVNRKDNIRLKKQETSVRLVQTGRVGPTPTITVGETTTLPAGSLADVTLTGTTQVPEFNFFIPEGDKGDKGDIGTSTFVRVHHATDPSIARPDSLFVEWVGSVAPSNATTEDTWVKTQ